MIEVGRASMASTHPTQNSDSLSVKFSVLKNFTNATVFSIKSPIFRIYLLLPALSISGIYRVLTLGFRLTQEA